MLELENIVEQIKEKQVERKQLEDLFNDKVAQLRLAFANKTAQIDNSIQFLTQSGRAIFESLPSKETKTQRKIALLSGDFVVKKPTKKLEADKEILLEYGKKSAPNYIEQKIIESFKWADFKKNLLITDDNKVINTATGEVIESGVSVIEVPEEVVIK